MSEDTRFKVIMDLLFLQPLIFRRIRRKLAQNSIPKIDISITPLHYEILLLLDDEGPLQMLEIGKRLQIAKAQVTQLINKLVESQLVERSANSTDRRIINISLTENGKRTLTEHRRHSIAIVKEMISDISDEEMEELADSLKKMQETLGKLR